MKINEIISPNTDQLNEAGKFKAGISFLGDLLKGTGKVAKSGVKATGAVASVAAKNWTTVLSGIFGASTINGLYDNYQQLKADYTKYTNGDKTTIFKDQDPESAKKYFIERRDLMVGEAALVILTAMKAGPLAFKWMSKIAGVAGGVAGGTTGAYVGAGFGPAGAIAGAKLGSMVAKAPFAAGGAVTKLLSSGPTGAAFMAFIASKSGQEFLQSGITGSLLTMLGAKGYDAVEYAKKLEADAEVYAKKFYEEAKKGNFKLPDMGVPATPAIDAKKDAAGGGTQAATPKSTLPPEKQKIEAMYNSRPLLVKFDPTNPNRMSVNGLYITDKDGYLIVDNTTVRNLQSAAKHINLPDITKDIPRKPGVNYF